MAGDPANNEEQWDNESSDLNGASDADSNGQLHLVLHGHPNGGYMLSGVGDEGQQDQTDERLWNAVSLGSLFDRSNEIVSSKGGDNGDQQESNSGSESTHFQLLFFLLTFRSLEKISVGLELEDQVGDVDEKKQNGSSTGDDKKT